MRARTPTTHALTLALLASASGFAVGCGAVRAREPAHQSTHVPPGDLPPAVPDAPDASNRGVTGTYARVVVQSRRDRVREAFRRYLTALTDRDEPALRALFDESVRDLEHAGFVYPRERVIALHLELLQRGAGPLIAMVAAGAVNVRSMNDLRRSPQLPIPPEMQSDDWLVDTQVRAAGGAMPGRAVIPRRFLIRFVGDEPVIVGISGGTDLIR